MTNDPSRDRQLKIVDIETVPLHIPFGGPFKISIGGIRPHLEVLLVRIRIEGGLEGIGETQAWRRWGSVDTLVGLKEAIDRHLAPVIIGKSPFELPAIVRAMDLALDRSLYAKAPLIDALYDLQGKILGVPVHDLLGGKAREAISACAILLMKKDVSETLDGAQKFYDRGFRSFTVKIGENADADFINVREMRKRFPDVIIRVDANASMKFDAALSLLKKIEPFEIDAAEQMVPPWDIDGMAELARRVDIPMMADESVATEHDLVDIIKRRAATTIQTKTAKNGGIWGCHKLWTIADAAGIRIFPGNHPTTSIGSASVVHLAAAWQGDLLDGPFAMGISGNLARDIVTNPLTFEGRFVRVPTGPGLGVTLDESVVRALRID
jgi:L-alanine-DL-glutamate epimerase-like enolase superfamily enzyme